MKYAELFDRIAAKMPGKAPCSDSRAQLDNKPITLASFTKVQLLRPNPARGWCTWLTSFERENKGCYCSQTAREAFNRAIKLFVALGFLTAEEASKIKRQGTHKKKPAGEVSDAARPF